MKKMTIGENESGQRLDKYLKKLLPDAPPGILYKMLRKKNITLNGRKASGNEKTSSGDSVEIYMADETASKFGFKETRPEKELWPGTYKGKDPAVVYEDHHVLILDKPAGLLSQPDISGEPSMVEFVNDYLLRTGALSEKELLTFHPSVVNRLDKNTTGLIAAGKTLQGLQELSEVLRERTVKKYYLCVVCGSVEGEKSVNGFLHKNKKTNTVTVHSVQSEGDVPFRMNYEALEKNGKYTLVRVELITGRAHQIRAYFASEGHPAAGDPKYGDPEVNRHLKELYGVRYQLLHCAEMDFGETKGALSGLSGKRICSKEPEVFRRVLYEQG